MNLRVQLDSAGLRLDGGQTPLLRGHCLRPRWGEKCRQVSNSLGEFDPEGFGGFDAVEFAADALHHKHIKSLLRF